MSLLVLDPTEAKRIRARRKRLGLDRWDEVWDGVYMMAPMANDEHQELGYELGFVFRLALGKVPKIRNGVNVSDRDEGWTKNYRCPDLVVFLPGTTAINRDTHWVGGPDFAVEVISKHDRARKKLDFYAKVNVRELLMVDRDPWALELYRLREGKLELVGRSTVEKPQILVSEVLPLSFRLKAADQRPEIEVSHREREESWSV